MQNPEGRILKTANTYIMSFVSQGWGWVNIDRFMKVPTKPLYVDLSENPKGLQVSMSLRSYQSLLAGESSSNLKMIRFPFVPMNEPVKLIAYAIKEDGNILWSFQQFITGIERPTKIEFTTISPAEFEQNLKDLDESKKPSLGLSSN